MTIVVEFLSHKLTFFIGIKYLLSYKNLKFIFWDDFESILAVRTNSFDKKALRICSLSYFLKFLIFFKLSFTTDSSNGLNNVFISMGFLYRFICMLWGWRLLEESNFFNLSFGFVLRWILLVHLIVKSKWKHKLLLLLIF